MDHVAMVLVRHGRREAVVNVLALGGLRDGTNVHVYLFSQVHTPIARLFVNAMALLVLCAEDFLECGRSKCIQ